MQPEVEARYLAIEWAEPGRARSVEVADGPLEIEYAADGTITIETQLFHDVHPWLGLRLNGACARATPTFVTAEKERQPMLRIADGEDGVWWVHESGWDAERRRHLSEMHRTIGRFEFAIGTRCLFVENVAAGAGREQLEEYLRDFRGDLVWLAMGFGGGTGSRGAPAAGAELGAALENFASAARRVLGRPALALRETAVEDRIARLRPNIATFRQHARRPAAPRLVGRGTEATADIAENRYLRHMVQICGRLARAVVGSAGRQAERLRALAETEAERGVAYRDMKDRTVIPELFDRELEESREALDLVAAYSDGNPADPGAVFRGLQLQLGEPYGRNRNRFFASRADGTRGTDEVNGVGYRVVQVPEELARRFRAVLSFSRSYTICGIATSDVLENSYGRPYRLVAFNHIVSVTPNTSALVVKGRRREVLERNGWRATLTLLEIKEMQKEARSADLRAHAYREYAGRAAAAAGGLDAAAAALRRQDRAWEGMGVRPNPAFPTGMIFGRNPNYAACLSAFRRVRKLAEQSGVSDAALDAMDRIGILHASALYERWCLVKIIAVLVEDYRFIPAPGWQDVLLRTAPDPREASVLKFHRNDLPIVATLEIQPVLTNGRRPDFRLKFWDGPSPTKQGGLVIDAKFRSAWNAAGPEFVLDDLVARKGYGREGDRVFILQPVRCAVGRITSPLAWGRDCDYGHDPKQDHRRGVIHLAPGRGAASPVEHLRRLIALELQATFPPPQKNEGRWRSDSFCIRCGTRHEEGDVRHKLTKIRENDFWDLRCSSCEMTTTRTHCHGCERPLFKNGIHLTYHRTLAHQATNVICPKCGRYIDQDARDAEL